MLLYAGFSADSLYPLLYSLAYTPRAPSERTPEAVREAHTPPEVHTHPRLPPHTPT